MSYIPRLAAGWAGLSELSFNPYYLRFWAEKFNSDSLDYSLAWLKKSSRSWLEIFDSPLTHALNFFHVTTDLTYVWHMPSLLPLFLYVNICRVYAEYMSDVYSAYTLKKNKYENITYKNWFSNSSDANIATKNSIKNKLLTVLTEF